MSQSQMAAGMAAHAEPATEIRTVANEESMQTFLALLDDPACRAILDATGEATLSASELSETCELPLSTTYRKLDQLTDAGLLNERTRIRRSGKHTSEYTRTVSDVVISMGTDGGTELRVTYRKPAADATLFGT